MAEYNVHVEHELPNHMGRIVVDVHEEGIPSSGIEAAVHRSVATALDARDPKRPTTVTVNVGGSVVTSEQLAKAIQDGIRRFGGGTI